MAYLYYVNPEKAKTFVLADQKQSKTRKLQQTRINLKNTFR